MSVRSELLATSEGALVSVSMAVQPRDLEDVLEALAQLDFPVNPQIYHDAAVVTRFADGHQESEPVTLVEFPAYSASVSHVRRAAQACGISPDTIQVTAMLEEIQADSRVDSGPGRYRVKVAHAR
jgi:hypothetical protein